MTTITTLSETNDIQTLIKNTFDANLPIDGGWGYTEELSTIIKTLPDGMPLTQLEHMLTSIRAHLEMNLTQEAEQRYGAINANERAREKIQNDNTVLDKVTYEVTAIKEDVYNAFIKEYKEEYGKEDFDLNAHFKKREEATLTREVVHYFDVSKLP